MITGKLVKIVNPRNKRILPIENITIQLASFLEKKSRFIIKGDNATSAPDITRIDGIAEYIKSKSFIAIVSKAHPIKNIVNPIVITDDIV